MKIQRAKGLSGIMLLFILFTPFITQAQTRELADCISQALESNYGIKMSRNTARMSRNNVNYSPFLPELSLSARQNQTRNETKTENSAGEINKGSDVKTDNYSAGVALNWRLFDGFDMFATHERFRELEAMGELTLQNQVEFLVVEVCSLYYQVIVQHYRLESAQYSLKLSNERYDDAQFRFEIGKSSGLDARQAIVDLQADSSAYIKQVEQLRGAYIALNKVMNTDLKERDYVRDTILMGSLLQMDSLEAAMLEHNLLLKMARKEQRVTELDLRKARAAFFPTLDFSAGYNYNRVNTPASSTVLNRNNGLYWGFSLNMPLFNRMQNRTRVKNARLEQENATLSYLDSEQEMLGDLALLYNTYENNLLMMEFERESASIAVSNLQEAMEMFKLGTLSGMAFREFQKSYTEAVDRKLTAMFQAKMSELSLFLISGKISGLLKTEPAFKNI